MSEARVVEALRKHGLEEIITFGNGPARLEEAAKLRGIEPRDIVKTLVVRRADDDYLFVLVPVTASSVGPSCTAVARRPAPVDAGRADCLRGHRLPTWHHHAVRRQPRPGPVIADSAMLGRRISMGGGAPGVSISLAADSMIGAPGRHRGRHQRLDLAAQS